VQQNRQVEQLRLLQFIEQFGVALIPFRLRLAQPMQIFDGDERVFVNRVAMGIVADHQRIDALQLRDHQRKKAEGMH